MSEESEASVHKDVIFVLGGTHEARVKLLQGADFLLLLLKSLSHPVRPYSDLSSYKIGAIGQNLAFSGSEDAAIRAAKFKITTKYYDADLQLLSLHERHDCAVFSSELCTLHKQHLETYKNRVDAVIVLHGDDMQADEHQRNLRELLELVMDAWEPSVQLYVLEDTEQLPRVATDWCMDNGYEVVGLNEKIDENEQFPEKVGLARVLEALETNMWNNMVYKTEFRPKTKVLQENDSAEEEENEEMKDLPPEVLNTFGNILSFIKSDSFATPTPNSKAASTSQEAQADDLDDLAGVDIISALGPLQQLRGQLANLPDDQRRKMAAKVAMAFMDMMGDDEEDEDIF